MNIYKRKFQYTVKDLRYFFVKKSDLFEKAEKKKLIYIRNAYNDKKVTKLIDNFT